MLLSANVGAQQPEVNKLIVRIDADSGLSLDLLAMVASIDVALHVVDELASMGEEYEFIILYCTPSFPV